MTNLAACLLLHPATSFQQESLWLLREPLLLRVRPGSHTVESVHARSTQGIH